MFAHQHERFIIRHEVKDSEVKTLLMTIFCRILTCKEYDTIKYIFEKVCILTTSGSEFFFNKLYLIRKYSLTVFEFY